MLAELVLDRTEVGILLVDSSLQIVLCNQYLEALADKKRQDILNRPVGLVFSRFAVPRYHQILRDCLERGQVRFCSGMIHPPFIVPEGAPKQEHYRQNLQVRRLEDNGRLFVLLQITDISDHFQRVFHLKHLIKDLGADFEQAKATGESMRQQAYYDHLTGIFNRTMFMHQLRYDIKQAERTNDKLAVLFLDLDGFKNVNDSLGHAMGDQLLQQVAARLKGCVRSTDSVARFGGDEFALILTNVHHSNDALLVAEKIKETIHAPFDISGNIVTISASIGCTLYPADSADPQSLIDMADRAMYKVKYTGKNNVALHEG